MTSCSQGEVLKSKDPAQRYTQAFGRRTGLILQEEYGFTASDMSMFSKAICHRMITLHLHDIVTKGLQCISGLFIQRIQNIPAFLRAEIINRVKQIERIEDCIGSGTRCRLQIQMDTFFYSYLRLHRDTHYTFLGVLPQHTLHTVLMYSRALEKIYIQNIAIPLTKRRKQISVSGSGLGYQFPVAVLCADVAFSPFPGFE